MKIFGSVASIRTGLNILFVLMTVFMVAPGWALGGDENSGTPLPSRDELLNDRNNQISRDTLRRSAIQMADVLKRMAALHESDEKSAREEMFKLREAALKLSSYTTQFNDEDFRAGKIERTKRSRQFSKEGAHWPVFLSTVGLGLAAGAYLGHVGYSGHDPIENSILFGVLGGAIGGPLGLLTGDLAEGIELKILNLAIPDKNLFFEELAKQGVRVPNRDREKWLEATLNNVSAEIFLQDSPSLIEFQIKLLETALLAAADTLPEADAALKDVLRGYVEALPSTKGFKRLLRPRAWGDAAYVKLVAVRNEFERFCKTHELDKRGYSFENDFKRNYERELRQQTIEQSAQSGKIYRPHDSITEKFLNRAEGALYTDRVLDIFRKSSGQLDLKIRAHISEPADKDIRPVGFASIFAEVRIGDLGVNVPLEVKFSTRVSNRSDLDSLIREGNWIAPLEQALSYALEHHPKLEQAFATGVRVEACAAQALPGNEAAKDAALEMQEVERNAANSNQNGSGGGL